MPIGAFTMQADADNWSLQTLLWKLEKGLQLGEELHLMPHSDQTLKMQPRRRHGIAPYPDQLLLERDDVLKR